jgi:lipopolysaccharide export system permease protein
MDTRAIPIGRSSPRSRLSSCAIGDSDKQGGSPLWITILHQQVLREVFQVFLLTLCGTTGLMMLVGVIQQLVAIGATAQLLLVLLPYFVPAMLPFAIPASLLFAVIIVYGRMGADSEIIAAKAAGINVLSLLTPSFVLGALLTIVTFLLTDVAVPWAARQIQGAVIAHAGELLAQQLHVQRHATGPGGLDITVARMDGQRMVRPLIRFRSSGIEFLVSATAAEFEIDRGQSAVALQIEDAEVFMTRASGAPPDRVLLRGTQTISLPFGTNDARLKSRHLTLAEIRRQIPEVEQAIQQRTQQLRLAATAGSAAGASIDDWTLTESKREYRSLRTEQYSRYALAYGSFGFALFGSALAALQASGRMLTNILFCFMPIVGVYYTVELGIAAQCKAGHLDPYWAMWTGNALLTGLAFWLIRVLTRR